MTISHLKCKLSILPLFGVWLHSAPPQVCLQVPQDHSVPRDNHATDQAHEPPVLDVDAAIGLWLVCCLLDKLQVKLVAERLSLQALLYDQLDHAHTVF